MRASADFCLIPMVDDASIAKYIATVQRTLNTFDIKFSLHACGTNLEGEWDEVCNAIKRCHEVLHEEGVVRIQSTIRIGTRTDKSISNRQKIDAVKDLLK
jgi:uncharacterized protein (TIGR00106 family)